MSERTHNPFLLTLDSSASKGERVSSGGHEYEVTRVIGETEEGGRVQGVKVPPGFQVLARRLTHQSIYNPSTLKSGATVESASKDAYRAGTFHSTVGAGFDRDRFEDWYRGREFEDRSLGFKRAIEREYRRGLKGLEQFVETGRAENPPARTPEDFQRLIDAYQEDVGVLQGKLDAAREKYRSRGASTPGSVVSKYQGEINKFNDEIAYCVRMRDRSAGTERVENPSRRFSHLRIAYEVGSSRRRLPPLARLHGEEEAQTAFYYSVLSVPYSSDFKHFRDGFGDEESAKAAAVEAIDKWLAGGAGGAGGKSNPQADPAEVAKLAEALRSGAASMRKVEAGFESVFEDLAHGRAGEREEYLRELNRGRLAAVREAGMRFEPREAIVTDGRFEIVLKPDQNRWKEDFRARGREVSRGSGAGLPDMPDTWTVWNVEMGKAGNPNPAEPPYVVMKFTDEGVVYLQPDGAYGLLATAWRAPARKARAAMVRRRRSSVLSVSSVEMAEKFERLQSRRSNPADNTEFAQSIARDLGFARTVQGWITSKSRKLAEHREWLRAKGYEDDGVALKMQADIDWWTDAMDKARGMKRGDKQLNPVNPAAEYSGPAVDWATIGNAAGHEWARAAKAGELRTYGHKLFYASLDRPLRDDDVKAVMYWAFTPEAFKASPVPAYKLPRKRTINAAWTEAARQIRAGWAQAREEVREAQRSGAPVGFSRENPAKSPEQYRLAQAVLSGTARQAGMPERVAREIVDRTPAEQRRAWA